MKKNDRGAAAVGAVETTMEPEPYSHPQNSNIVLWDLPGVGTPKFPKEKYLEKVGVDKYDCFIMLTAERFTENDEFLAKEFLKKDKRFYFARNKVNFSFF